MLYQIAVNVLQLEIEGLIDERGHGTQKLLPHAVIFQAVDLGELIMLQLALVAGMHFGIQVEIIVPLRLVGEIDACLPSLVGKEGHLSPKMVGQPPHDQIHDFPAYLPIILQRPLRLDAQGIGEPLQRTGGANQQIPVAFRVQPVFLHELPIVESLIGQLMGYRKRFHGRVVLLSECPLRHSKKLLRLLAESIIIRQIAAIAVGKGDAPGIGGSSTADLIIDVHIVHEAVVPKYAEGFLGHRIAVHQLRQISSETAEPLFGGLGHILGGKHDGPACSFALPSSSGVASLI